MPRKVEGLTRDVDNAEVVIKDKDLTFGNRTLNPNEPPRFHL